MNFLFLSSTSMDLVRRAKTDMMASPPGHRCGKLITNRNIMQCCVAISTKKTTTLQIETIVRVFLTSDGLVFVLRCIPLFAYSFSFHIALITSRLFVHPWSSFSVNHEVFSAADIPYHRPAIYDTLLRCIPLFA